MGTDRAFNISRAITALSLVAFAIAAWRAIDLSGVVYHGDPPTFAEAQSIASSRRFADAGLTLAAETNPFTPERSASGERYRMPDEANPSDPSAEDATVNPPMIRLLGTVVLQEDRGLALIQWGEDPPRLVRVGQSIGTLRLQRVDRGRAVLVDEAGSMLEVSVPKLQRTPSEGGL